MEVIFERQKITVSKNPTVNYCLLWVILYHLMVLLCKKNVIRTQVSHSFLHKEAVLGSSVLTT